MFMRYFGGGIGHTAQTQLGNEGEAMDVDEGGDPWADNDQGGSAEEAQVLGDVRLLEELHRMAHIMIEGERAGDRDEVEATIDCINDADDVCMRGEDDILPEANGEAEDVDLGPEDGEDGGYFDIGFGAL
jgi:hypothetical protein